MIGLKCIKIQIESSQQCVTYLIRFLVACSYSHFAFPIFPKIKIESTLYPARFAHFKIKWLLKSQNITGVSGFLNLLVFPQSSQIDFSFRKTYRTRRNLKTIFVNVRVGCLRILENICPLQKRSRYANILILGDTVSAMIVY